MTSQPATPGASTPMDLIGKTVRWANHEYYPGQWFTALVTAPNTWGGFEGECVDPGNWRDRGGFRWSAGQFIPNMRREFLTVIDSEPVTEDEECE